MGSEGTAGAAVAARAASLPTVAFAGAGPADATTATAVPTSPV